MHPSELEAEDGELEGLRVPECHMEDEDVEGMDVAYSTRAPGDWVLSGPLGNLGAGPGRRFATASQAEAFCRSLHGDRVKGRIKEASTNGGNRWAFLIQRPEGS